MPPGRAGKSPGANPVTATGEPVPQMPASPPGPEGEPQPKHPVSFPPQGSVAVPPPTAFYPEWCHATTTGDVPVCAGA